MVKLAKAKEILANQIRPTFIATVASPANCESVKVVTFPSVSTHVWNSLPVMQDSACSL